jgi:ribosomal protein L20
MNNLGAKMSINRYVISSKKDEELIKQASDNLSEQTKNYRAAKNQYKKANCKSVWDR